MKIERINDEQIKFILSKDDLSYHDVKYTDLVSGNAKLHELFRDMMTQAMLETDFTTDPQTPLIVETVPMKNDSVMIIVTKSAARDYIENKFNIARSAREERRYRRKPFIEATGAGIAADAHVLIYVFKSLDEIGAAAARLDGKFLGQSSVYKKAGRYYLVMQNEGPANTRSVEAVLTEYGHRQSSSVIYKLHLEEYGEVIVAGDAVGKLAGIY